MEQDTLDNFRDQNEFWYVSKNDEGSEGNTNTQRKSDKWWFKVPPTGLSDIGVKWIQFQKDSINQLIKAAMTINAQVLSEMEIPENFIESLPKLEPMTSERKARWRKEIEWLLSIMTTRQRSDILMNIPAMHKLATMLIVSS
ncbi:unnamed protein product [Lupinus luteus]|uniref:PRONE domain-containing protein n=1 Tax=Lupinus luteus TaxID=3873 RepID=A0AAV1WK88_LUPLU